MLIIAVDELGDIRERIAKRANERRVVWLRQLRRRYSAWMLISGAFALLTIVIAALTKSLLFGIAAAFLCLFAWNRHAERKLVERWLSRSIPENQRETVIYAKIFYDEMSHPSMWLRISNRIAAAAAVILVVTICVVVIATSGFWIRLLYGITFGFFALLFLCWIFLKRRFGRELKTRTALSGSMWSELT